MIEVGRFVPIAVLALVVSACGLVRVGGPDEERAETFEFLPAPVGRQEAVDAFTSMIGPGTETLIENSVVPLGKINTSAGPIVFAEFQIVSAETGRSQCSGSAGAFGGSWGCGPIGQAPPGDLPGEPVMLSSAGSSGTWSEVELRVGDDVAFLEALAADGTQYRMEPIAGIAWMEWKSDRGELTITAFDAAGEALGSVETDAN